MTGASSLLEHFVVDCGCTPSASPLRVEKTSEGTGNVTCVAPRGMASVDQVASLDRFHLGDASSTLHHSASSEKAFLDVVEGSSEDTGQDVAAQWSG